AEQHQDLTVSVVGHGVIRARRRARRQALDLLPGVWEADLPQVGQRRAVAAAAEDHANLPRGIINEAKPGARRRSPPHPQIRPSGPRQLPVVVLLLARVGYMTWAPAKQVS